MTLWDVATGERISTFHVDKDRDRLSRNVEFVGGDRLLATSHSDRSIRLFTVNPIHPDAVLMPPDGGGGSVPGGGPQWAVSEDGGVLAAPLFVGERGKRGRWHVKLLDVAGREERDEIVPGGPPCSLSFSPDARLLAIAVVKKFRHGGADPDVGAEIWDLGTRKRKYQWMLPRAGARPANPPPPFVFGGGGCAPAVQFAPGGGTLATICGYQAQLWSLTPDGPKALTDPWRADARGHASRSIGFSSDASWVAAVDADETGVVKIWDTRYGRLLAEARRTDYVWGLAFSADGTHFATSTMRSSATSGPPAAWNWELLLWDVPAEIRGAKPGEAPRQPSRGGDR